MTDQLISAWLEGTASAEARAELAAQMRSDPELRRQVTTQALMHGVLRAHRPQASVADRVMAKLPPGLPPRPLRWWIPLGLISVVTVMMALVVRWPTPQPQMLAMSTSATVAQVIAPVAAAQRTVLATTATQSAVIAAEADAHVDAGHRGARLGTATRMQVGGSFSAYLRFTVPHGCTGRGALVLTRASGAGSVAVHRVGSVGTWEEADLSWWHRPLIGDTVGVLGAQGDTLVLMLTLVPGAEVEFALVGAVGPMEIYSRESGQRGPRLEVDMRSGQSHSDF